MLYKRNFITFNFITNGIRSKFNSLRVLFLVTKYALINHIKVILNLSKSRPCCPTVN